MPRGVHHTLVIEEGDDVKVQKMRWRTFELDRIDEAVNATRRPHVIIVCIDDESAVFAAVRQSGVEKLSEIFGPGSLKGHDKPPKGIKEAWLQELVEELAQTLGVVPFRQVDAPEVAENHELLRAALRAG